MATDAGWGRRLRTARRAYEERHDTSLSYQEIGNRVGALVGRGPFKHPTVRAWFVDGQEPDSFSIAKALATVLEVDAGALITGADPPIQAERRTETIEEVSARTGIPITGKRPTFGEPETKPATRVVGGRKGRKP